MKNFAALFGGELISICVWEGKKTSARRKIHTKKHNFFFIIFQSFHFPSYVKNFRLASLLPWLCPRRAAALQHRAISPLGLSYSRHRHRVSWRRTWVEARENKQRKLRFKDHSKDSKRFFLPVISFLRQIILELLQCQRILSWNFDSVWHIFVTERVDDGGRMLGCGRLCWLLCGRLWRWQLVILGRKWRRYDMFLR